jgi:hypothetical protein
MWFISKCFWWWCCITAIYSLDFIHHLCFATTMFRGPPIEASSIDRTQQSSFTCWRGKSHPSKRCGCKTKRRCIKSKEQIAVILYVVSFKEVSLQKFCKISYSLIRSECQLIIIFFSRPQKSKVGCINYEVPHYVIHLTSQRFKWQLHLSTTNISYDY